MTVTNEDEPALARAQRRFLRRIYNGRTQRILVDGKAFMTYKEACQYLLSLEQELREAAYQVMKAQAKSASD